MRYIARRRVALIPGRIRASPTTQRGAVAVVARPPGITGQPLGPGYRRDISGAPPTDRRASISLGPPAPARPQFGASRPAAARNSVSVSASAQEIVPSDTTDSSPFGKAAGAA